ncbi:hypothetical protein SERLA73DRAFT_115563 [Serpula lacrymans var. lacrymans S7.3]|uniref:Tetraspanin Tsp2 family n=2 Tax=Serpula lacrymans var. lacrymans TaxID=341189 RepID=F8QD78_SERL3|nr:uncharacterized protein SERLADRAFT_358695 [Serpula lacrymans var. lacrymans S7.9]EGN93549.1 hypothetical protein SERLA73DRAFT_115563 [Serpula lacrymans var. lacrymans S7.3]EGO18926.1 hypothetical protein SERLADRAFT_358695 [Serpula lacrymans var. lacrymans S7.9]
MSPLEPPSAPFATIDRPASDRSSNASYSPRPDSTFSQKDISLSVNYLPSKFSSTLLSPRARKRKGKGVDALIPKRGGGREAFKSSEARMPAEGDEDYDGVTGKWFGGKEGGHTKPRLRWNKFKWALFIANVFLSAYALCGLIFCLCTWFDVFERADIVRVGNRTELIISTTAAALAVVTSLIGWAGILLNNRSFLAVYTFLLWICFALLVTPGYLTYKQRTFNLEGKVNSQWSRDLGAEGRLRIQNRLHCCGYFSPFVEATVSQTCYARSILPGCKQPYLNFERHVLTLWYTIAFALVPLQIAIIVAGLLCSNHVTYRFGKGMMPKAYRLSMNSMAVIMDNYANQLAEQYGSDVASDVMTRSRSNLQLDTLPYSPITPTGGSPFNTGATNTMFGGSQYDSLARRAPDTPS